MIVDGKRIAENLRAKIMRTLPSLTAMPTLVIVSVGGDAVTGNYIRVKKKVGEMLDIPVIEHNFPNTIKGDELKKIVQSLGDDKAVTGIIVQLPLPAHIDAQSVLDCIPITKDIDMISSAAIALFAKGEAIIFPPIAAAIQEILETHHVDVAGKEALVLGYGRLVGKPASIFLRHNHAHVTVVDRPIADLKEHVRESDIVICGTGSHGIITADMLKDNAVVIDAGTSESEGRIVGDAHPDCALRAALFTPVPGGVGPIAIAMIFKNLSILACRAYDSESK